MKTLTWREIYIYISLSLYLSLSIYVYVYIQEGILQVSLIVKDLGLFYLSSLHDSMILEI